jgi:hypothetical protein
VDKRDYLEKLLALTLRSRDTCRENGMKFTLGGKTYIVRDLAEKVLSWVDFFKAIGDIVVQYDPGFPAPSPSDGLNPC